MYFEIVDFCPSCRGPIKQRVTRMMGLEHHYGERITEHKYSCALRDEKSAEEKNFLLLRALRDIDRVCKETRETNPIGGLEEVHAIVEETLKEIESAKV